MVERPLSAVVLAAGEGTRMRSARPKPLHRICGRPMILHVLDALAELQVDRIVVVVGHRGEWVSKTLMENAPRGVEIEFVEQATHGGTGDALAVALTAFPQKVVDAEGDVLVLPGDTPLVRPPTLAALVRHHRASDAAATLLTASVVDTAGHDRVVRGKNNTVIAVLDDSDSVAGVRSGADPLDVSGRSYLDDTDGGRHPGLLESDLLDELDLGAPVETPGALSGRDRGEVTAERFEEIATNIVCFRHGVVSAALRRLQPVGSRREHSLSGMPGVLHDAGYTVTALVLDDPMEAAGVNDRAQLAVAEAELRDRINERWMRRGVTMWDPESTYIDASVELEPDAVLLPGVILQGRCSIAAGAEIGPDCRLVDTDVGDSAVVMSSFADRAVIGVSAKVGPFCVLNPGSRVLAAEVIAPHTVLDAEPA